MSWLTVTWLMVAAASVVVAIIHGFVWTSLRGHARANGAFTLTALSLAFAAIFELGMLRAETTAEYGRMLWAYHFPVWTGMIGCVLFVWYRLEAGRRWLGWCVIGARTVVILINGFSSPNLNYLEITGLSQASLLGEQVTVAHGIANPWMLVGTFSGVLSAVFIVDATLTVWRRGERRRAFAFGGLLTFCVLGAVIAGTLSVWGLVPFPVLVTPYFVPILIAMGAEAGGALIRSVSLATELASKEGELRESEAKLRVAAEAAEVALWRIEEPEGWVWSTASLQLFSNEAGERYRIADFLERVHPEDRRAVSEALETARRTGRASVEYRIRPLDGEERWLSSIGGRVGREGRDNEVTGVSIDITDRRRAEVAAARQRLELDRLSRVSNLSEFSSAMAHELSQPLAIILSNAEAGQTLLRSKTPDLDELSDILDDIVGADERAANVLNRLRDLLGRGVPSRERLHVDRLLSEVLDSLRADLEESGVEVEFDRGETPFPVMADRILIEQVIFNLVRNASQAMESNLAGERRLSIGISGSATEVVVRFSDLGVGLPEPPERVFEPFFTTKAQGLGVGLPICRSILESHGGRLGTEPNGARGAVFWFSLPVTAPAPREGGAAS